MSASPSVTQELIRFKAFDPHEDSMCLVCRDSDREKPWVVHDVKTNKVSEFAQHYFHKECLSDFLMAPTSTSRCPTCKDPVDLTSVLSQEQIAQAEESIRARIQEDESALQNFLNFANGYSSFQSSFLFISGIFCFEVLQNSEYFWTTAAVAAVVNGFYGFFVSRTFFSPGTGLRSIFCPAGIISGVTSVGITAIFRSIYSALPLTPRFVGGVNLSIYAYASYIALSLIATLKFPQIRLGSHRHGDGPRHPHLEIGPRFIYRWLGAD